MKYLLIPLTLMLFFCSYGQTTKKIKFLDFENSKNVNLSFEIPEDWERNYMNPTNDKDNFVAGYINYEMGGYVSLYITQTPFNKVSKQEVRSIISSEGFKNSFILNSVTVISQDVITINGYPYLELTYVNYSDNSKQKKWITIFENKLINITCQSLMNKFNNCLNIYNSIGNSLIII